MEKYFSIDDFFDNNNTEEDVYIEDSIIPQKEVIENWMNHYAKIAGTYVINDDLTIDVEGNIEIDTYTYGIKYLPSFINFNF